MSHEYAITVSQVNGGKGGSEGRVGTLDAPNEPSLPVITIQSPAEFKGPADENGKSKDWTPEHLYVASAAVCYFTTFVKIAEASKLKYTGFSMKARGILDEVEGAGRMITEIHQHPTITIDIQSQEKKAKRVLEKTAESCLIANSMKTKVIDHPVVKLLRE